MILNGPILLRQFDRHCLVGTDGGHELGEMNAHAGPQSGFYAYLAVRLTVKIRTAGKIRDGHVRERSLPIMAV